MRILHPLARAWLGVGHEDFNDTHGCRTHIVQARELKCFRAQFLNYGLLDMVTLAVPVHSEERDEYENVLSKDLSRCSK